MKRGEVRMVEQKAPEWTGYVVKKMHINAITKKRLSQHLNLTQEYVGRVLSGKEQPKGAEIRFTKAVNEIINAM